MLLIPDNNTFRQFVPNTMAPAMGETPLYSKIRSFLVSAENWFCNNFIPRDILKRIVQEATDENDPLYFLPRRIVVLKAWAAAVPSIDVVVGPTGVGVTETSSLKPASKAKIDNLLSATNNELDANIEALVNIIYRVPDWLNCNTAERFRTSLFPDFQILDVLGVDRERYKNWLVYTSRAANIERRIARESISIPVMSRLRSRLLARLATGVELEVAKLIQYAVVEELRSGIEQKAPVEDAVNIIRQDKVNFPEWDHTDTADRFKAPAFRNHKHSSGYFL